MRSFRFWPESCPLWCHPVIAAVLLVAGLALLPSPDEQGWLQSRLPEGFIFGGVIMGIAAMLHRIRDR